MRLRTFGLLAATVAGLKLSDFWSGHFGSSEPGEPSDPIQGNQQIGSIWNFWNGQSASAASQTSTASTDFLMENWQERMGGGDAAEAASGHDQQVDSYCPAQSRTFTPGLDKVESLPSFLHQESPEDDLTSVPSTSSVFRFG